MPKRITTEEIKGLEDDEGVFYKLIDLSKPEIFARYHLPNAISVPFSRDTLRDIQRAVPDLDATVILYSQHANSEEVWELAAELEAAGYEEVFDYTAGERAWRSAALPVDPPRPLPE